MLALQCLAVGLLAFCSSASAYSSIRTRSASNNVTIVDLSKNMNATSGNGNVAAAGSLQPFGGIGMGCGVKWVDNESFGGGVNAGTEDFGLGGDFMVNATTAIVGAGIGTGEGKPSARFVFTGSHNGSFEVTFTASVPVECVPTRQETGNYTIVCSTTQ